MGDICVFNGDMRVNDIYFLVYMCLKKYNKYKMFV